ncbi:MAG: hypothetical protein HQK60_11680 [Deltaproteobacteria bacterium]|nr:hypothetical protein [Deltaproteobacteria bacterium]
MPVTLLLCEGGNNSPDVRVLNKLLSGLCEVRPMGGKYGMGERIKARREAFKRDVVFGLLDGDFLDQWVVPQNKPGPWVSSDGIQLGWRWERKEIENYLIDPQVVSRALGHGAPPTARYGQALRQASDKIAIYQAARTALSVCRRRFRPLPSAFGPARGREEHPFPDDLTEIGCRQGIRQAVETHQDTQTVTVQDVLACFNNYLPDFLVNGVRSQHYLHAFAGKDILWAMDEHLRQYEFAGAMAFREKILQGIRQTSEDIADWHPEWRALREQISRI